MTVLAENNEPTIVKPSDNFEKANNEHNNDEQIIPIPDSMVTENKINDDNKLGCVD